MYLTSAMFKCGPVIVQLPGWLHGCMVLHVHTLNGVCQLE